MNALPHVLAYVMSQSWALEPSTLHALQAIVARRVGGVRLSADELAAATGRDRTPARRGAGTVKGGGGMVGVIPIRGVIAHRASQVNDISGPGGTSIEQIQQQFRGMMGNDDVRSVVLEFDSPGGSTAMLTEMAAEIRAAPKRVVAVVNPRATSAAYWLASQAAEVVATPSGFTGSIGVFAAHEDMSGKLEREGVRTTLISAGRYKTEGNPFEPLGDDALNHIQDQINAAYDQFVGDVAAGRNVTTADVIEGYGQGRTVNANDALAAGMIDRVATFDAVLGEMVADAAADPGPAAYQRGGTLVRMQQAAERVPSPKRRRYPTKRIL